MKVPVYILAGGRSRRYGSDKARADIDGVPQIIRLGEVVRPVASDVTVVAATAGAYADLGFRTIGDIEPGLGPMGGLATALADADDGWVFVVACDWVGIDVAWLGELLSKIPEATTVICYKSDRYEPLLALYHTSLCDEVRRRLESGARAMQDLLDDMDATIVPLPAGWARAQNLNSPPAEDA